MSTPSQRRATFRRLHQQGCFVIPNPWDAGTARWLQRAGFSALATTSAGAAFAMAYADGAVPRDAMLGHIRTVVEATDVPVNADFGNGFADDPAAVADNVRHCVATGVAGLSVEDGTGDAARPLYEPALAVERVRAARAAIDAAGGEVLLTARAEGFVAGRPDLDDAIRRLRAYADAGADCLFAPGIATREQIGAVVAAVAPKPVNVLAGAQGLPLAELAALGVRRVSVGSGLARVAWGAFMRAARAIATGGTFETLAEAASGAELNAFFAGVRGGAKGATRTAI
jgi:2-methylisocitrate lyase-like PEP mutase family enzyme